MYFYQIYNNCIAVYLSSPWKINAKKQNGSLGRPYKSLWKEEKWTAKEKRKDISTPLRHTKYKLTGFLPSRCVFFLTIKGFIHSSVLRRGSATAQQAPRQVAVLSCARFLWSNTYTSRFSQQGLYLQVDDMLTIENVGDGLSWWLGGKESTYQFRRHRFHPWSEKIPCAVRQLSLCTAATEPVL